MTISRRLVELMGGRLWAESEVGKGSSFRFTCRVGVVPGQTPTASTGDGTPAPSRSVRLRILLAEDNRVNQLVATRLLEKLGHEVTVAGDGQAALEALERGVFDVGLFDVQMPRMDGLEAIAELRRREAGTGRRLPVFALTAHAMKGDREICLAAGMDGYLTKPFRLEEVRQALLGVSATPELPQAPALLVAATGPVASWAVPATPELPQAHPPGEREEAEKAPPQDRPVNASVLVDATVDLASRGR